MCEVSYFKTAAQTAYYASSGSALLIPNAWPAVSIIYEGQGDPDQILHAAMDWWKVSEQLGQVMQQESQRLLQSLTPDDWSGTDREEFNERLSDFERQCLASSMHAAAISISLYGVAALLMVFIVAMSIVAAILFALAMWLIAMAVAGVFSLGTGFAAAQAQANIIAGKCYAVLKQMASIYENIMRVAAGIISVLYTGVIGVGGNVLAGNKGAALDLLQGSWNSVDDIIAGSLGKLDQSVTSGLMKGRMGGQQLFGWTVPTKSIPRDIRPYLAPLAGIKASPEAGFPGAKDYGTDAPIGLGSIYPPREYGDEYVEKTHPDY